MDFPVLSPERFSESDDDLRVVEDLSSHAALFEGRFASVLARESLLTRKADLLPLFFSLRNRFVTLLQHISCTSGRISEVRVSYLRHAESLYTKQVQAVLNELPYYLNGKVDRLEVYKRIYQNLRFHDESFVRFCAEYGFEVAANYWCKVGNLSLGFMHMVACVLFIEVSGEEFSNAVSHTMPSLVVMLGTIHLLRTLYFHVVTLPNMNEALRDFIGNDPSVLSVIIPLLQVASDSDVSR